MTNLLEWEEPELKEGCFGSTDDRSIPIPTRCQEGDVWQLGRHFLYCTNSENKEYVSNTILRHGLATLVFTDPPYNFCSNKGGPGGFLATKLSKEDDVFNTIKEQNLAKFDPSVFLSLLPSYFKPGSIAAFIFHSKDSTPDYYGWVRDQKKDIVKEINYKRYDPYDGGVVESTSFKTVKAPLASIACTPLVWYKVSDKTGNTNAIPFGGAHHADVEYLMYIRLNGKWNDKDKAPFAHRGRVLEYPKQRGNHPTVKPVELIQNQILLTTDVNDLVYDPYCGSGSTLLACERSGRRCIATEKLPKYCDLTISRWEGTSGHIAEKVN